MHRERDAFRGGCIAHIDAEVKLRLIGCPKQGDVHGGHAGDAEQGDTYHDISAFFHGFSSFSAASAYSLRLFFLQRCECLFFMAFLSPALRALILYCFSSPIASSAFTTRSD